MYLEGLTTGDFEPVFRELVGKTAALPANTIARLKATRGEDYEARRTRSLEGHTHTYSGPMGCIWELIVRRTRAPCCAC